MSDIGINVKLKIKDIVTNSNLLSSIRRQYRYQRARKNYIRMQAAYKRSSYPERIEAVKGVHSGKRCFVIGNGPSLIPEDLDLIKDEYSFAANRIYLMYEKTSWRPTFYMCQDRQLMRTVSDYYSSCEETVFLGYPAIYDYGIDVPKANYYLADNRDANRIVNKLGFSDQANEFVVDGGSVTYSAIQMAVFMGFKIIYLLGVDHNFSHTLDKNRRIVEHKEVKEDYFDKRYKDAFKQFEEKGKTFAAPDKGLMDLAFEAAFEYGNKNGIKIFNATRGGKLEVFPRVNLEEILKENA